MFTKDQLSGIDRSVRNRNFYPTCTMSVDLRDIVVFIPRFAEFGYSDLVCIAWVDYAADGHIVREVPEVLFAVFVPDESGIFAIVDYVRIVGGLPRDQVSWTDFGGVPINLPYVGDVLEHTNHPY